MKRAMRKSFSYTKMISGEFHVAIKNKLKTHEIHHRLGRWNGR